MDLTKRREEVITHHRRVEKERGSGWHPADPGAEQRERRGELPLSERPVALLDDDRVHLVGPCADRVREALRKFLGRVDSAGPRSDFTGNGRPFQEATARHARRAVEGQGDLEVSTQAWNYLSAALASEGVQAAHADADPWDAPARAPAAQPAPQG